MAFIQTLGNKPWIDKTSGDVVVQDVDAHLLAKRLALNFFLGVVTVLFSLFIVTFLARSQYPDFKALAGDVWQPLYNPVRLWINTGFLLAGGIALQMALVFCKRGNINVAILALTLALGFSAQFLVAQGLLWRQLEDLGFYITGNPATSYFYLLTAVHAVHVLGGVLVLGFAGFNFWRLRSANTLRVSLVLCARYWHYMFIVWLILFGLLVSSPATYKTLAALCGY